MGTTISSQFFSAACLPPGPPPLAPQTSPDVVIARCACYLAAASANKPSPADNREDSLALRLLHSSP